MPVQFVKQAKESGPAGSPRVVGQQPLPVAKGQSVNGSQEGTRGGHETGLCRVPQSSTSDLIGKNPVGARITW